MQQLDLLDPLFVALDGDDDVYECSYVQSDLTDLPFFASRVKIGRKGVEAFIPTDLQGLSEYEQKALAAAPNHNMVFSAGSDGKVVLYKLSSSTMKKKEKSQLVNYATLTCNW